MTAFSRSLLGALSLLACTASAVAAPAPGLAVRTASGPIVGVRQNDVRAWLGVPYAAQPVGDLRWKPPRLPQPWRAPRLAAQFGNSCPQYETLGGFASPAETEDCLNLNVYAPSGRAAKNAPVLVWLFGGGFSAGSANDYDPASLVRQGAVVVTVNYRLGMLGFYANPALGPDNAAPNYGLLDQIAALKWVQRNIAGFGGDPRRVTIFGESAGARAVGTLLGSPMAKGLFSGAIMESLNYEATRNLRADAETSARRFAKEAGCADTDIACLKRLTPAQVLAAQRRTPPGPSLGGIIGGPDVPLALPDALKRGAIIRVPMIIGWNHDEFTWRNAINEVESGRRAAMADYAALARRLARRDPAHTEADAAAIMAAYPVPANAPPVLTMAKMQTDSYFVCGTRRFLRDLDGKAPVWAYEFEVPDVPHGGLSPSFPMGSSHTSEIQFLFEGFHGAVGQPAPLSPQQLRLARQMQRMWVSLARSGRPDAGAGTAPWPQARPGGTPILHLKTGGLAVHPAPYKDRRCDLWDRIAGD